MRRLQGGLGALGDASLQTATQLSGNRSRRCAPRSASSCWSGMFRQRSNSQSLRPLSLDRSKAMIERDHQRLTIVRQTPRHPAREPGPCRDSFNPRRSAARPETVTPANRRHPQCCRFQSASECGTPRDAARVVRRKPKLFQSAPECGTPRDRGFAGVCQLASKAIFPAPHPILEIPFGTNKEFSR